MSFYKILAKAFLLSTVLAMTACTGSPPQSQTPAVETKLTLAQELQNI
jgi:hypothetical protein